MLDVIADFWKPVKKAPQAETLKPELLQIGSSLGFGFVPQAILSGRRLHITAINTYLFGEESLTSFVLSQNEDPSVSMIVAESDGEYYLAISRRISQVDRSKLFDEQELDTVMSKPDAARLNSRNIINDYKGWVVASYKREIQGLKGSIFKGDFRKNPLPPKSEAQADAQNFEYTLLVSESNEHAIEIEKYTDGRIEIYATVYRRMNDIGEIIHPAAAETARPDVKLASSTDIPMPAQAPVMSSQPKTPAPAPVMVETPKAAETKQLDAALKAPEPATEKQVEKQVEKPIEKPVEKPVTESAKSEPITLQELSPAPKPATAPTQPTSAQVEQINPGVFTVQKPMSTHATAPAAPLPVPTSTKPQEPLTNQARTEMSTAEALKPKLYVNSTGPDADELKNKAMEGDNIECDLRVANKIIDEAIRNEMRLTDIVRRIIELPVAYPESVQIPMTLTDSDFSLLAIRYGISASDRNAIKRRIIEDLNDFSGKK